MIVGMIAGITGLVVAFTKLFAATIQARVQMDKIMGAMQQATGSAFFAKKEFEFVSEVADRMGQKVSATAEAFAQFAAAARDTKVEGQGVRTIFEGVLSAVTALRLPTETQTGLFRALTQMMSKGVIQSEELRGQFGERLAGGFEIVRKKIGATRAEFARMLKAGELIAEKFIIPIGEAMQETFGEQALKSAQTFTAAVNRMDNAQFEFNLRLEELIDTSGVAIGAIDTLTASIKFLTENLDNAGAAAAAFGVTFAIVFAPQIVAGVKLLWSGIKLLTAAVWGLNLAMLANPAAALTGWIARLVAGVAAGTGAFFLLTSAIDESANKTRRLMEETEELLEVEELRNSLQLAQTKTMIAVRLQHLKVLEAEAQAVRDFIAALPKTIGRSLALQFSTEELEEMDASLAKFRKQIEALQTLVDKGIKPLGGDADEVSKAMKRATDKVEELGLALERAEQQMASLGKKGADTPAFLDALFEAQDILKDLSTEELDALNAKLAELGITGMEPVEALRQLVFQTRLAEDQWKDMLKTFERSPKIMRDLSEQLSRMDREMEAMGRGIGAFEVLQKQFAKEDAIRKYAETLAKMSETFRAMLPTVQEFADKLDVFDRVQTQFEELKDVAKGFEDALASAFESAIIEGENLRSVLAGLLKDLASFFLKKGTGLLFGAISDVVFGAVTAHGGGKIGSSSMPKRNVSASVFRNAQSLELGGVAGLASDEVPTILHRGETVRTLAQEAALKGGGGGVTNHFVVDMRGASSAAVRRLERFVLYIDGSLERRALNVVGDSRRHGFSRSAFGAR
jgi:tape measure domain-containing protein